MLQDSRLILLLQLDQVTLSNSSGPDEYSSVYLLYQAQTLLKQHYGLGRNVKWGDRSDVDKQSL